MFCNYDFNSIFIIFRKTSKCFPNKSFKAILAFSVICLLNKYCSIKCSFRCDAILFVLNYFWDGGVPFIIFHNIKSRAKTNHQKLIFTTSNVSLQRSKSWSLEKLPKIQNLMNCLLMVTWVYSKHWQFMFKVREY
jgi:hypothetical protein